MNQTIRLIIYVLAFFLAWQIFAFVSQGNHPWVLYNADALNIPLLYESIVHGQGSFSDWTFPSTTYFFPDISLYFLLGAVIKNRFLHVITFGVLQILYFVFILDVLGRIVTGNKRVSLFPLIALLSLALLSTGVLTNSLLITLVVSNFHMGATLMTFTLWALLLSAIKKDLWWKKITLLVLAYATAWSDATFAYGCLLPMIGTLVVLGLARFTPKRFTWHYLGLLIIATFASQYFVHNNKPLRMAAPAVQYHFHLENYVYYFQSLRYLYQNNSLLFSALIIFLCLSIGQILHNLKTRNNKHILCLTLIMASIATFLIGSIVVMNADFLISHGPSPLLGRHLQETLLFPVLCGLPALIYYHYPLHKLSKMKIGSMLMGSVIISAVFGYKMDANNLIAFHPPYVACLDKLNLHHTLQTGLTSYRDAKPIRFLSQTHVQTVAYDELHDVPQLWINSISWYRNQHVNFVIWRKDINHPPALRYSVKKAVGLAKVHLTFANYNVWMYSPNQLDPLLQRASYVPKGPFDFQAMYDTPNTLLKTRVLPLGSQ